MSKLGAFVGIVFLSLGFHIVHHYDIWPAFWMWFCFTLAHNIADHKRRR